MKVKKMVKLEFGRTFFHSQPQAWPFLLQESCKTSREKKKHGHEKLAFFMMLGSNF
jgi:hypothetical protein